MDSMSNVLAVVTIVGFAIQQSVELFSPVLSTGVRKYVTTRTAESIVVPEPEIKKWVMTIAAVVFGIIAVYLTEISLLEFVKEEWSGSSGDFIVSVLVVSAGTEGLNTLTKYFGYVKEGRKAQISPAVELTVVPSSVFVTQGQTLQFTSIVKNASDSAVKWQVVQSDGGSISNSTGFYTAPSHTGIYNVIALSVEDGSKHAIATVTVK